MRSRIRAADHDPRDALNACREATAGRAPSPRGKRKRTRERGGVVDWWCAPGPWRRRLCSGSCRARAGLLTARSGGRGAAGPVMAPPVLQLQRDQSSGELPGRERRRKAWWGERRWNLTGRWEGRKRWLGVGSTDPQPPAGASHRHDAVSISISIRAMTCHSMEK